ncbi:hypothetical protein ACFFNY_21990 [Paenibacillus hodogayensis]|uniref:Uncharacterized protein n=1 Tax=Paenibacillus hodogayensis TaxID=279208 RepID=A0ABV5W1M2_9BACL
MSRSIRKVLKAGCGGEQRQTIATNRPVNKNYFGSKPFRWGDIQAYEVTFLGKGNRSSLTAFAKLNFLERSKKAGHVARLLKSIDKLGEPALSSQRK